MPPLSTLKDVLRSESKRRKLRLLLSEQLKIRMGGSTRIPDGLDASSTPEVPVETHWTYPSRIRIPAPLLEQSADVNFQDTLDVNGIVNTEFEYDACLVKNACMYTNGATHITVFDSNGRRMPRYSYTAQKLFSPASLKLGVGRKLAGRTLNLYGNLAYASGNIGHWTVDGLPRLFLSHKVCASAEIDQFVLPPLSFDYQLESLIDLGVDETKIIELQPMEVFQFEELVCTSAPRDRSSAICPGWVIDAYRQALGSHAEAHRRIYISRRDSGSRKFVNEDDITNMLSSYDFEIIELSKFNFREKIRLFEEAEFIVGLTGAGMTNLMFCNKGTSVIELTPSTLVHYIYASMADYLALDYHYLLFENSSDLSKTNRYFGNFILDVAALERMLKEVLNN